MEREVLFADTPAVLFSFPPVSLQQPAGCPHTASEQCGQLGWSRGFSLPHVTARRSPGYCAPKVGVRVWRHPRRPRAIRFARFGSDASPTPYPPRRRHCWRCYSPRHGAKRWARAATKIERERKSRPVKNGAAAAVASG